MYAWIDVADLITRRDSEATGHKFSDWEADLTSEGEPVEHPIAVDSPQLSRRRRGWRNMGRRRRIVFVLAILAALIAVSLWQELAKSTTANSTALVGRTDQPAPTFSLPALSDSSKDLTLASFRGEPLVINFWESWCIPCQTEMPLLEQAYRAEKGKVHFLGIDSNDTSSAARAFLRQVHVTYPAVSDSHAAVAMQYALFGFPTTVFISPSGRILGRHIGQLSAGTLRVALQEAFGA